MTSKLNINWLNKCRCGNRMHTVETVRGSHVRLFEDDAVKCNSCGREGVIQTCDGIATVLWETDAERAEGEAITKLTREENVQAVFDLKAGYTLGLADVEILKRVARMALAEMGSEPVVQPVMFIDGDISSDDADKLAKIIREFNEEDERPLAKMARIIRENPHPTNECDMPKAQPAPVVPDRMTAIVKDEAEYVEGWNACRAAMLQAVPLTNEGETILHNYRTAMEGIGHIRRTLEETFGGLHGTHVEPDVLMDCKTICDAIYAAYSGNSPVIPDGYVMVPINPTGEMQAAGGIAVKCETTALNKLWTANKVYQAMLAAAPQEVKGEHRIRDEMDMGARITSHRFKV
ncbi:hypothetical protein [Raoultella ornithinolytica]|uniref:hypothetical protein n=1 Tax=Raoultella ornithinolytica TaxID=54291 RepID=UPI0019D46AA9|nr:hypothetical protein [Raoultella ornithinolytica]